MKTNQVLQNIEQKWLELLFEECKRIFQGTKLPSHDHIHHLRVWYYAKELITSIDPNHNIFSTSDIENIIIACFFHDTGMSIDKGTNHGKISKEICIEFFNKNKKVRPSNLKAALDAIERHDDKEYKSISTTQISFPNILSILSVSDDLDAFGIIGVYRYTEIYLLRGISTQKLPENIIKNLQNRFDNFCFVFSKFPKILAKQKDRYLITKEFFERLKSELTDKTDSEASKIINIINDHAIKGNIPPEGIYDKITTKISNNHIINFFDQLKTESILPHSSI